MEPAARAERSFGDMRVVVCLLMICFAVVALACGDDDAEEQTLAPQETPTTGLPLVMTRHLTASGADELLRDLGLGGLRISADEPTCVVFRDCPTDPLRPDEPGCITIRPAPRPVVGAGSPTATPPQGSYWWLWEGDGRLSHRWSPEPIRAESATEDFKWTTDTACGGFYGKNMTAAEATEIMATLGITPIWTRSGPCPTGPQCVYSGFPNGTEGCLSIFAERPRASTSGNLQASFNLHVSWLGDTFELSSTPILFLPADGRDIPKDGAPFGCFGPPGQVAESPHLPGTELILPAEWLLSEEPAGDVLQLHVAIGGGCDDFNSILVDEDDERVTIRAYITETIPAPFGACTDQLDIEQHDVELDDPLGDRTLLGCDPLPDISYLGSEDDRSAICREFGPG